MMPLTYAQAGEENVIRRIGGRPDTKKHLEDLGFVVGSVVCIVSKINDNVIVNVKDTRIAISSEMATKIYI
ncbi:MAG: ferrous iron transport protein A [Erysipelotrichaceae bacterium]|nr:ferrous iron transport protein A [Erysipelotrichaceae bacterium]